MRTQATGSLGHGDPADNAKPGMRHRALPIVLFVSVTCAYGFGNMGCGDSMWTIPTAVALLDEGTPRLDRYLALIESRGSAFIQKTGGHYYTVYPFATSLIAAPAVAVLRPIAAAAFAWAPSLAVKMEAVQLQRGCAPPAGEPVIHLHSWTEALIASAIVAATTVLMFNIASVEVGVWGALLVALIFAFATSAWSTASRSLWQHSASMLMLALALNWQVRGRRAGFAGASLAAAYAIRPTNAIPLAFGAAVARIDPRAHVMPFLAGAACVGAVFTAANLHVYGAWLPPYYHASFFGANQFFWEALGGQLLSPARGLFVYSPVLIGSLAGVAIKLRQRRFTALDLSLALTILVHWILISAVHNWWGGHSYGPRFFTDMLPYLVYFLIPLVAWFRVTDGIQRAGTVGLFAASIGVSVFMHGHGALSREAPYWNQRPLDIDYGQDRLWDWRRPPFLAGITFSPSKGVRDANSVVCSSPPGAPANVSVVSSIGSTVVLTWGPAPGSATSYAIEAGSAPGLTNQGTRESWASAHPIYSATRVPPGTYFVRVRAKNGCGFGPASDDVKVVVR